MKRLAAALLVTLSLVTLAWAQQSTRQLSIGDRVNPGAYARVTHANELIVNCAVGCAASTFDSVNVFHQSTIRHISSVTHVGGFIGIRDGLCPTCWARVNHAGELVTSASVTTVTDNVNVFHQSTIRHVSSVTHVSLTGAGAGPAHLSVLSTVVNNTAQRSTVAHVTSVTHVAGLVSIRDDNCLTCRMRVDHYNVLVTQPHISGALRTWQVSQCGTTASLAVNTNENRRDLWLMNRGNGNIYIGYGTTGHVALTTGNGWPIHATASAITTVARHSTALSIVYLQNYQGPIACIADLAGTAMQVMEILR